MPIVASPAPDIVRRAMESLRAKGFMCTMDAPAAGCGVDLAVLHYPARDTLGAYTFVLQGGRWTTTRCLPWDSTEESDGTPGKYVAVESPLDGLLALDGHTPIVDAIGAYISPPEVIPGHPLQELPYRLVDDHGQGWRAAFPADRDMFPLYVPYFGHQRDLSPMCHHELTEQRGPMRVVVNELDPPAITLMVDLLAQCNEHAVTTLTDAARQAFEQLAPGFRADMPRTDAPVNILISPDETSSDAKWLRWMANYAESNHGNGSARVHAVNGELLAGMIMGGAVMHDDSILDMSHVLPTVFGEFADHIGAQLADPTPLAVWKAVAHRYLQPQTVAHSNGETLYRYLMRESRHYDPAIWRY